MNSSPGSTKGVIEQMNLPILTRLSTTIWDSGMEGAVFQAELGSVGCVVLHPASYCSISSAGEDAKSKVKAVISLFFFPLGLMSPFYSKLHQAHRAEISGSVSRGVMGIFLLCMYA